MFNTLGEVKLVTHECRTSIKLNWRHESAGRITFRQKLNVINNTYARQLNHMVWNPITNNTKTCKPYERCSGTVELHRSASARRRMIRFPLTYVRRYYLFDWRHNRTSRIWIYFAQEHFSHEFKGAKAFAYRAIVYNEDSRIGSK